MRHKHTLTASDRIFDPPRRFFTVEQADKALVLVRRIVQDVVRQFAELNDLRARREELSSTAGMSEQAERLRVEVERHIESVNKLTEELNDVGCEITDYETGLVDFPAQVDGRTVLLCWRLGETSIGYWHELEEGFKGRKPIGDTFAH